MSDRDDQLLQQQADRYQALLKVTEAISVCRDLRELCRELTRCLPEVIEVNIIGLALYDAESEVMRIHSLQANIPVEILMEGQPISLDCAAGFVWKTQQPLLIQNLAEERRWPEMVRRMREDGAQSWAAVPLNIATRRLGLLAFSSINQNAYGESNVEFLKQVAKQVAVAVDNALAYQQIEALKNKLAKEKRYLEEEIRTTSHNFEEIVGENAGLKRVLQQVETVAPTDSTVLILGETGTGKELIARAIHNLSGRRERTFVKMNCAAIPTGLLESELFGHERGAFTGAIAQKIGRFELAHQGTLFLDEVGDIPFELQSKLLRVLQEQEFERLGSNKTIKVNVRLIAATNQDFTRMVADKEFRSDLYYRLNVFPIQLPPLRERRDDIPQLVYYFTQKYAQRLNKRIESIPTEAMEAISRYPWPGNIRELENFIERAVILSKGSALKVEDSMLPIIEPVEMADSASGERPSLEKHERDYILKTLERTRWVIDGPKGAAKILNLHPNTLRSRMQKLGIHRSHDIS